VQPSGALLRERGKLMLEGVLLACQGRNMWQAFVAIHMATNSPIKKGNIQHLSLVSGRMCVYVCVCVVTPQPESVLILVVGTQCVELLKVIEFTFRRMNSAIAECQSLLLRQMASEVVVRVCPLLSALVCCISFWPQHLCPPFSSCAGHVCARQDEVWQPSVD